MGSLMSGWGPVVLDLGAWGDRDSQGLLESVCSLLTIIV